MLKLNRNGFPRVSVGVLDVGVRLAVAEGRRAMTTEGERRSGVIAVTE